MASSWAQTVRLNSFCKDRNTRAVFGDSISISDIQRAVEDRATVSIYYESRLAKLDLDERERLKTK